MTAPEGRMPKVVSYALPTEALAQGTEAFAARRMNKGITLALAGKNIESI